MTASGSSHMARDDGRAPGSSSSSHMGTPNKKRRLNMPAHEQDEDNSEWTVVSRNKTPTAASPTAAGKSNYHSNLNPRAMAPARSRPKANPYSVFMPRAPLTPEQRKEHEALLRRQLYIKTVGESIQKMAKAKPLHMKKLIEEAAGCPVESIMRTEEGLRLTFSTEEKRQKAQQITSLAGVCAEVSVPRALARSQRPKQTPQEVEYEVRGVIFGLEEDEDNLLEIASELRAKYAKKMVGYPKYAKKMVGYPKGHTLPEYVHIFGQRFRIHTYIPRPKRYSKCQTFGPSGRECSNPPKCCRCGQGHSREDCGNTQSPKCLNCRGPHSAASMECPKYRV